MRCCFLTFLFPLCGWLSPSLPAAHRGYCRQSPQTHSHTAFAAIVFLTARADGVFSTLQLPSINRYQLPPARTLARSPSCVVPPSPSSVLRPPSSALCSPPRKSFSPSVQLQASHSLCATQQLRCFLPASGLAIRSANCALDPESTSRVALVRKLRHYCMRAAHTYLVDRNTTSATQLLPSADPLCALHGTRHNVFWKETRGPQVQEK